MVEGNSLANFWGLGRENEYWKQKIVFPDFQNNVYVQNQLVTLSRDSQILPPWAKGGLNRIFFSKIYQRLCLGEPLLTGGGGSGKNFILIQKDSRNRIVFNFDPLETMDYLLAEGYLTKRRCPLFARIPYGLSVVIPASLKKLIRWHMFRFSNQEGQFPDWPIEKSIELIRGIFLECIQLQGIKINQDGFWPQLKKFAIVLTHDVDTIKGFKNVDTIATLEEKKGFVSTWFMLAKGYAKDKNLMDRLLDCRHEIAMHGDYHDNGLAFLGVHKIRQRLRSCSDFIDRYKVKGFRTPSLLHSQVLMDVLSELGFYDSSICDTGRLSPFTYRVGCCSVFPYYMTNNMLEIPITLALDSSLIFLKFSPDEMLTIWKEKTEWVREVGGVLLLDTHPEPHFIADKRYLKSYRLFLDKLATYNDAWVTTAGCIANWWRRRIGSKHG